MKKINYKRLLLVLLIFIILVIYYFLVRFKIFSIPCPIKWAFHIFCPGCGVTRMLVLASRLKFKEAFTYNQLAFILTPFVIVLGIDGLISYIFEKPVRIINKIPKWIYIAVVILVLIYGILRNVPGFEILAPKS